MQQSGGEKGFERCRRAWPPGALRRAALVATLHFCALTTSIPAFGADQLGAVAGGSPADSPPVAWHASETDFGAQLPGGMEPELVPQPELDPADFALGSPDADWLQGSLLVRGYYLNDRRLEWTGLETTLAAEAALAGRIERSYDGWDMAVFGDFYINQRFDKNILVDTAERRSYQANWDVDVFQISNLWISAQHGNWTLLVGKMETPFGRYYGRLLSNARIDAPFIRTESIHWRETGALAHYQAGPLVIDAAVVNGTEDKDTNASKGLVSRVGLEGDNWALGASIKVQDGVGSEWQKVYNSHVGVDWMVRRGGWILWGEAIGDEYGLKRDSLKPTEITWERSIYNRDLNNEHEQPIHGVGYYVGLGYQSDRWWTSLNYGEFYPQQIGDVIQDQVNRRGIFKVVYDLTPWMQSYVVVMAENGGFPAQAKRDRMGGVVLTGLQATF